MRFDGLVRKLFLLCALVCSAAASYVGVSVWRAGNQSGVTASKAHGVSASQPVNPFASATGTHLIAFVITASDCGWSSRPATMRAIGGIRQALRSAYGNAYADVSVIGVDLDQDLSGGLRFLAELGDGRLGGAFDQVIVGGSWLNEEVVRFVWRERIAQAAAPEIVILERPISAESYLSTSTILVQSDRLLATIIGSAAILQWVRDGLPLQHASYAGGSLHGTTSGRPTQ